MFMVGRAHESAKRYSAAANVYREYARKGQNLDRRVEANTRLGQVLMLSGDERGADRALQGGGRGREEERRPAQGRPLLRGPGALPSGRRGARRVRAHPDRG